MEAFAAYEEAKRIGAPLIICGTPLTEASAAALEEMVGSGLSRALIWGTGADTATIEALRGAGLTIEEVG